jgi:hypothetical protein
MSSPNRATWLLRGVLLAGMVAGVAELPLLCLRAADQDRAPVLSERESVKDAKETEAGRPDGGMVEHAVSGADFETVACSSHVSWVSDELAEINSALAEAHLQRGPPRR